MGQRPDEIKAEIAATRRDLDRTLDELEDRLSLARIVQRRVDRAGLGHGVRSGGGIPASASTPAGASSPPRRPEAEESPPTSELAGGLLAFGAGLLAACALPPTELEGRAVQGLVEAGGRAGAAGRGPAGSQGEESAEMGSVDGQSVSTRGNTGRFPPTDKER